MSLRGVIFDLDGTLVDSGLDFDAIRRDLRLQAGEPILESLSRMPPGPEKDERLRVLRKHELLGAKRAALMPGVSDLLAALQKRSIKTAVLTRNSRESTELTLERLEIEFSVVLTRDDVPPKPDPTGLLRICRDWGISPDEAVYIGDFLFDVQAGIRAGMRTILYAPNGRPDYAALANFTTQCFSEILRLVEQMSDENPG